LFLVAMKESGQAGAVAAGAFDRPSPLATVLVGELQEVLVAGRGGGHVRLAKGWPVAAARTAAVWVWVSTPMTTSTESASMCIALCSLPGG
jgi:hypothetical protein